MNTLPPGQQASDCMPTQASCIVPARRFSITTNTMKFYITKYALTEGIKLKECEAPTPECPGTVYAGWQLFRLGKDAFDNWGDAYKRAQHMRVEAIASCEKKLKKLRAMEFVRPL